jgi:hypothetical protein
MVLPFLTQVMVFRTFLAAGVGEATGEFEGVGMGATGEAEGVGATVATAPAIGNLLMS